MNRLFTVAASVPDTEKPRLRRGVSPPRRTDLREKIKPRRVRATGGVWYSTGRITSYGRGCGTRTRVATTGRVCTDSERESQATERGCGTRLGEVVILFMNRLFTVAASVPDTEKPRLRRGVSPPRRTDLRKNSQPKEKSQAREGCGTRLGESSSGGV